MKNAVIVLAVLAVLAVLGVGGYFYMKSSGKAPKLPGAMVGNKAESGGNVFTSIKDALSKSISLKCVFKDDKGVETTSYIKNGAVRVEMAQATDKAQPNKIIMKEMKMHMWSDQTKEGIVLTLNAPENISPYPTVAGQEPEAAGQAGQQESILATIEKYKDACKPEVVADSMFTVPTDVKFQDMDALQKEMMKSLPQAPQGAPQGSENPEDYQKYIEQMMQQQGAGQ